MIEARCRKCRCVVASGRAEDVLEQHQACDRRPREFLFKDGVALHSLAGQKPCTHLFVQEQPWMDDAVRCVNDGVIPCPRCSAKLGTFRWSGLQCSCGAWVSPALSLLRSKLDITVSQD